MRRRSSILAAVIVAMVFACGLAGFAGDARAVSVACSSTGGAATCTATFGFTGDEQQFVVPAGVSVIHVEAIGAAGQPGADGDRFVRDIFTLVCSRVGGGPGGAGGKGARVEGSIAVTGGQTLYVAVGGSTRTVVGQQNAGGFNGGGRGGAGGLAGGFETCSNRDELPGGHAIHTGGSGGVGGGASDVRTCSKFDPACPELGKANDPRLIVAGGGGGGGGGGIADISPGFSGGDAGATTNSNGGRPGFHLSGVGSAGGDGNLELVDGVGGGGGGGGGLAGGEGGFAGTFGGGFSGGGGSNLVPSGGSSSVTTEPAQVRITYVIKLDQTITFPQIADRALGDPDFDPGAIASSGLPVTYGVGGSNPCSIVDGKVHLTGVGTCTVTAAQEGNADFNPAPSVSRSFTIVQANQPPEADAGPDQSVSLSGSSTATVTLDGSGSTDDGQLQPLTYSWAEAGNQLGTGQTLDVSLGLGVHAIRLTVDDGQHSSTDEVVVTVVDPTPPAITPVITGSLGANGWYTSDVHVAWSVGDPESPVTSPPCDSGSVTSDTGGTTFSCSATSAGGTSTATATIKRDATRPTATIALAPASPDGLNGWYVSALGVTVATVDEGGSEVAETRCALDPSVAPTSFDDLPPGPCPTGVGADGEHTLYAASKDNAGNAETPASVSFKIDQTDPTLTCDGTPSFLLAQAGASVFASVSDETSGSADSPVSAAANTRSAGAHSATVIGFDQAGNETNANCPYVVTYVFPGFLAPIDASAVNVAKAGQTVPVVWKLADENGAPIADPASFVSVTSTTSTCSPAQATDDVEAYSGGSGLQYLGDGVWQFNWKTAKSYAGQCRTLKLNLADGTVHTAEFRFK